jgi:hypothetical protein
MNVLNPTPADAVCDRLARPYFLWDEETTTLAQFLDRLRAGDDESRALDIAKLMRQAKPDDVFTFVQPEEIARLWPRLERNLGRSRELWTSLFSIWERLGLVTR